MAASNNVPAVMTTVQITEFLAQDSWSSATMTEISEHLSLNKSTCFRILKTLESLGYIKFDEATKRYSLGYRFIAIGERARQLNTYISIASSLLEEMEHPEVTFVLVKRTADNYLTYVAKREPTLPIRLRFSGDIFPIPYGALGKCFLAFLPENEQQEILQKEAAEGSLPQYTSRTKTSLQLYEQELAAIRKEGVAESDMEYVETLSSIACPIFDSEGRIVLGIGAYMLSHYKPMIDTESVKQQVKLVAQKITAAISGLDIQ